MAESAKDLINKYKDILASSRTAYTANVPPTPSDIKADAALRNAEQQARTESSERLKARYYPEDAEEGGQPPERKRTLEGVLKAIGAPLAAVTGGVEALLGKGTKPGLDNITANIEEGGTWGDIFRSYNLPNVAAAPLGFALDVATDPLTLFTGGSTAFLPRVAKGFAKAGIEGAAVGAKSGLYRTVVKAGRFVPGLSKRLAEDAPDGKSLITTAFRKAAEKADVTSKQYDDLVGEGWEKFLQESATKDRILDRAARSLKETESGRSLWSFFGYPPGEWFKKSLKSDLELAQKAPSSGDISRFQGKGNGIDELITQAEGGDGLAHKVSDSLGRANRSLADNLEETLVMGNMPRVARAADSSEQTYRMLGEARNASIDTAEVKAEIERIRNVLLAGKTEKLAVFDSLDDAGKKRFVDLMQTYKVDLDGYDKRVAEVLLNSKAAAFLETYADVIGAFKIAKVPLNLASAVNAVIGNIAMTSMIGVNIANEAFVGAMKQAAFMVRSGDVKAMQFLAKDIGWQEVMRRYPTTFRAIFGVDPRLVVDGRRYIEEATEEVAAKLAKKGIDSALARKSGVEIKQAYDKALKEAAEEAAASGKISRKGVSAVAAAQDQRTTLITDEILLGAMGRFVRRVEQMAAEGKPGMKLFHAYLTKPMDWYSKIDQTYKLGLATHLTNNGVTDNELRILAKRFAIGANDAKQVAGRNTWKLTPMKAMEIANETYMNYLAMPGFVKMMRTLPVLGSPFMSFTYGMTALAAKTALYNPAFFNKVQLLLREISGNKSPLEKEALDSKYYNWLDQAGMVKMPFFQENPLYLNMENMLPHYTLSLLAGSERTYGEKYGDKVARAIDRTPFFKDPVGQLVLDYVIMPQLIGEAQGMFGQPLWPKDAGALEKAGLVASSAAESVIPTVAGFAGIVPTGISPEALRFVPSFRYKQLQNALYGRTSLGVQSKEPPATKSAKVLSAMAGFPIYQVDLRYAANKASKDSKK